MFGKNPIRKPEQGDGSTLSVQEVFLTFQGEGPNTGVDAVFVRLGGCNLACAFCDTEFESFADMTLDGLLAEVERVNTNGAKLVVITGGEPLRQPIGPLCDGLLAKGYQVQLETNGTLMRELDARVEIVCSPKAPNGAYFPLRPDVAERVNALKFIVSAGEGAYHDIAEVGQSTYDIPVYIQPMDEYDAQKNAANEAHARALVAQHDAHLSIQTHKLVGAP